MPGLPGSCVGSVGLSVWGMSIIDLTDMPSLPGIGSQGVYCVCVIVSWFYCCSVVPSSMMVFTLITPLSVPTAYYSDLFLTPRCAPSPHLQSELSFPSLSGMRYIRHSPNFHMLIVEVVADHSIPWYLAILPRRKTLTSNAPRGRPSRVSKDCHVSLCLRICCPARPATCAPFLVLVV